MQAGRRTRASASTTRIFRRTYRAGDTLLLDDGRIVLAVTAVKGSRIYCLVEQGGALSNNKGINRKGGGLTAPALTEKDVQDIKTAALLKARLPRGVVPALGCRHPVGARPDAQGRRQSAAVREDRARRGDPALEEIVDASDAIMVARGDLAVEVGDAVVPGTAKTHDPDGARAQQARRSPRRR